MGLVATTWILAGTWIFTLGLTVVAVLGQLEYYNMVRAKGIRPAQRAGIAASVLALWVAAAAPLASEAVFPVSATLICTYMLLHRREKFATIADISTTFMGMFYAGYLPTFWVRMRALSGIEQTRFPAVVSHLPGVLWPSWLPPPEGWTVGAALTWWTWLSVASSDIGALFIGRAFGRHKLSDISPKKTVEGAIGGFLCASLVSILGAFLLKWPIWWLTGTVYGILIGVVGLLGDLTASLFKRDAGFKDSPASAFGGRFRWALPGHGGILDRTDSFVFTAPLVYYFVTMVLPAVRMLILRS
jgi:phosphatidate cytidylyltransferase